jgi:hypothetical protein
MQEKINNYKSNNQMKKIIISISIIVFIVLVIWVLFNTLTRKSADWNFIQRVGGIKTEKPIETEDGYYLPILCNVSGWDSITVKPITTNSSLFCLKTKVSIKENKIYLTVATGMSIFGNNSTKCKAAKLGNLKEGTYKIYYKDNTTGEHSIGEFTIEKQVR